MNQTGHAAARSDAAGRVDSGAAAGPQEALLKGGALQNAILGSANFAVIATDEKGVIQFFNAGAEHMLGYTAGEVVNRLNPSDLHDLDEVMARAEALSLELATTIKPGFDALCCKASRGTEDTYELAYVSKDGSRVPAIVAISALYGVQGDVIGYLLISASGAMRQQVEAELTSTRAAAETASLAKSDFLMRLSHELRTPLHVILGFAQLMETSFPPPAPSHRQSLDQIIVAGRYLLELSNEVLDLSLIESGKVTLSSDRVSLGEVMLECRSMVEPEAKKRGIRMTFPSFDAPRFVKAERTRLKQALINLLLSAIRHNKPGTAVVVEYTSSLKTPDCLRIGIRDSGKGLTPELLAQLFQPFNRLARETGNAEGAGIGLVVARQLVELMGGTLGADSAVGAGTEYWIELSLSSELPPAMPMAALTLPVQPPAPESMSPRTVLYVEDNAANMELVKQLVGRRPDLRLLCAMDGPLGIDCARANLPSLILMDINMPGMSGIEAMEILRADPATAHIPIIALSANAMPRDIKKGLEAGFFDYVTKPIVVGTFMNTLDAALNFSQRAVDGATYNPA